MISVQWVEGCAYRQVLPAAYLDMFHLIFLDCELSLRHGLNCTIVSLGTEASCLGLCSKSDVRPSRAGQSGKLAMFL